MQSEVPLKRMARLPSLLSRSFPSPAPFLIHSPFCPPSAPPPPIVSTHWQSVPIPSGHALASAALIPLGLGNIWMLRHFPSSGEQGRVRISKNPPKNSHTHKHTHDLSHTQTAVLQSSPRLKWNKKLLLIFSSHMHFKNLKSYYLWNDPNIYFKNINTNTFINPRHAFFSVSRINVNKRYANLTIMKYFRYLSTFNHCSQIHFLLYQTNI